MDEAKSAMERVPLMANSSANDVVMPSTSQHAADDEPLSETEFSSQNERNTNPSLLDRILDRVHAVFSVLCRSLGYLFLRMLSIIMLHCGIIGAGVLQMLAFYYTGVLNSHVLLACLLYAPALCAISVIREEIVLNGTSHSGAGPRITQEVAVAYLILSIAGISSVLHPLFMHAENMISYKSMWTSIGATTFYYYCLLISEVLFASASNVQRSRDREEELERQRANQPFWITRYEAIHSKDNDDEAAV
ncbi:hypothetical protein BWQ96_03391 [Gracilariopsis chorda]|uniref:Uncharacterized protein n=1 Tax=Gracilariopsis chorda TaxID=448386 RepID=A0A2V3IXJ4_9FLOR|nr:hypothetical protein BWQ96_03391 [Gracilariopsis chorda]|eukprot:PXF46862.1 hypothetical protein BWQ96_03391 [Gracilariopsis chorda]